MLEPMKELLVEAKRGGYAVPAPNVFDKESVEAAFNAAEELDSPVILDVGYAMGIEETGVIAKYYGTKHPRIPWALNLDHGGPFEHVILAIRSGYSSVMVDRSTLSFEDNVVQVADVVRIAHAVGVSVEAELGHVGQGVEYEATRDAVVLAPATRISGVQLRRASRRSTSIPIWAKPGCRPSSARSPFTREPPRK